MGSAARATPRRRCLQQYAIRLRMLPLLQPLLLVRLHRALGRARARATLHLPALLALLVPGLTAAQLGDRTSLPTPVHPLAQRPLPSLLALMAAMLAQALALLALLAVLFCCSRGRQLALNGLARALHSLLLPVLVRPV